MTHMHPDHEAGLIDSSGKAVFPKVELILHENELTFWRDDGAMARATTEGQGDFRLARAALAAYAGMQFAFPDTSVAYDIDPAAAAEARRKVLKFVAGEKLRVAGVHLDFPRLGMSSRTARPIATCRKSGGRRPDFLRCWSYQAPLRARLRCPTTSSANSILSIQHLANFGSELFE
jgi:hypothetical protein